MENETTTQPKVTFKDKFVSTVKKAKPYLIGAALGVLGTAGALALAARDPERFSDDNIAIIEHEDGSYTVTSVESLDPESIED